MNKKMGVTIGEELNHFDSPRGSEGRKAKMLVSVRFRPASERDKARHDFVFDWDCVNSTTILFKSKIPKREIIYGMPLTRSYRVFSLKNSTRALVVLNGINSSIFVYDQTSSEKTCTMSGTTKYAIADIFNYMETQPDREYDLKFSAIEIYNESIRDLLSIVVHGI